MKTKLTLSVRKEIIRKAKSKAKSKGISVSELFEQSIKEEKETFNPQKYTLRKLLRDLEKQKPVQPKTSLSDKDEVHKHWKKKYA